MHVLAKQIYHSQLLWMDPCFGPSRLISISPTHFVTVDWLQCSTARTP